LTASYQGHISELWEENSSERESALHLPSRMAKSTARAMNKIIERTIMNRNRMESRE
jgi:hypothetical protein